MGVTCMCPRYPLHSYSSLEPLHLLWLEYMAGLLRTLGQDPESAAAQGSLLGSRSPSASLPPAISTAATPLPAAPSLAEGRLLLAADLHGCHLGCVSSRDVRHSGIMGIVAAVTRQVLCIVTSQDRLHGEGAGSTLASGYSLCCLYRCTATDCVTRWLHLFVAVVPKKGSVFRYEVPGGRLMTVNGEALCTLT